MLLSALCRADTAISTITASEQQLCVLTLNWNCKNSLIRDKCENQLVPAYQQSRLHIFIPSSQMRKFNSAGLEYLLVPDKAENSSVLDKAKNPLVADNGKIHSSQSKWTQTTTKISFFGIPIHWCQKFHFHKFLHSEKNSREISQREMGTPQARNLISVRCEIGVRWVPSRPETQQA